MSSKPHDTAQPHPRHEGSTEHAQKLVSHFIVLKEMAKVCVFALVIVFMARSVSLQEAKVKISDVVERGEWRAYDIHVECPNPCTDKVREV